MPVRARVLLFIFIACWVFLVLIFVFFSPSSFFMYRVLAEVGGGGFVGNGIFSPLLSLFSPFLSSMIVLSHF